MTVLRMTWFPLMKGNVGMCQCGRSLMAQISTQSLGAGHCPGSVPWAPAGTCPGTCHPRSTGPAPQASKPAGLETAPPDM